MASNSQSQKKLGFGNILYTGNNLEVATFCPSLKLQQKLDIAGKFLQNYNFAKLTLVKRVCLCYL
uniref:Uncharacterized protein n=1 Tax=Tolypothrix bouteillei VB521301 TaxID=1479485 RepID=A0A0C1QX91_9CYAN